MNIEEPIKILDKFTTEHKLFNIKHCDDYSRCRLKAYRTKTKEILSILKGE